MENGAYGRYPLLVRIPRADMHGSTVGLRYTEYVIEVDDCGKVYTRARRYTMFAWLHTELRQRELACALPELPPKKVLGNRESAFVERRRQMLEDYLKALLLLPAVIQDGMIWAFLDADEATAVVPRFLCRHATHPAAEKCLGALKRAVADQKDEVFRLCDATVLEELAKFARAEAAEAIVPGQQMQVRLKNRGKLCFVLYKVICYDRARQKLVQSDVLGALLALLCRVTEDEAALEITTEQNSAGVIRCVKRLIQETNGEALLYFCQQEGAVHALRNLATSQVPALHTLCAWVLWFGLRCPGVVTALAGAGGTRGLFLLGDLLKSPDLCARVLARLCIGWIVRQEGAIDADAREFCLQALAPLAAELDAEETRTLRRALETGARDKNQPVNRFIQREELSDHDMVADFLAGRSLDNFEIRDRQGHLLQFPLNLAMREAPTPATALSERGKEGEKRTSLSSSAENLEAMERIERDPALVKTLQEICSRQELPRLQVLLGDDEIDTATACVVAILDHFLLQGDDEAPEPEAKSSARAKVTFQVSQTAKQDVNELQPLVPQLEALVQAMGEGQMVRGGGGAAADQPPNVQVAVEEVRVRAARILVRIKGAEAASLHDLGSRACILEVLMRDAEALQAASLERLAKTREHCEARHAHIVQGSLSEDPCLHEKDLQGFKQKLRDLAKHRGGLRSEVDHLKTDLEAMDGLLEQRCIKHGILARDVMELCHDLGAREDESRGSSGLLSELQHYEEVYAERLAQVEQLRAHVREAEVRAETASLKEAEAKAFAERQRQEEAALEEFCHTAPAKLERCQCRLDTVYQQKCGFGQQRNALAREVDRQERRHEAWQQRLEEAKQSLRGAQHVGDDLERLKPSLNSETIMTDEEVAQLRQFEAKLPGKPARLARLNEARDESDAEVSSEGAPIWDDQAEKEFQKDLHFRALRKLRDERHLRWTEEERWLREGLRRSEEGLQKLRSECGEAEGQEKQMQTEEDSLRKEIEALNDPEAHLQRLADARASSAQAASRHEELHTLWAEAHGAREMGREQLQRAEDDVQEVLPCLEAARAKATDKEEATKKVRQELQARFVELERRARDFLQEWRGLEKKEQSLGIRQDRVDHCLGSEAEGREGLRAEVHELIVMLQQLDQQLVQS